MDLPSGLKWATCNIGANKPEDPGLLFQWGRTDGYEYGDNNHKFLSDDFVTTSGKNYSKGDILKKEDDAAYIHSKGKLRMPTREEIDELLKYTDNFWTNLNHVKGRKFVSKKDKNKWIFIPAAGHFFGFSFSFFREGYSGYIWSSSSACDRREDNAYYLYVDLENYFQNNESYYNGLSIRGVYK